ncbi:hypothetical protein RDZ08_21435 [Nitratireductor indicus]|nr:hypothetical protein [Nitratireductor indicus]MDS1138775.1 hypothetical protein [Nitratireductor indicus]
MKKSKFSEAQIAFILRQADEGTSVEEAVWSDRRAGRCVLSGRQGRVLRPAGREDVQVEDRRVPDHDRVVHNVRRDDDNPPGAKPFDHVADVEIHETLDDPGDLFIGVAVGPGFVLGVETV